MPSSDAEATRLKKEAEAVLRIMRRHARRALILELTGTPKAGKTTSVTTLKSFFKECGYRVHLLKERAADCPLPMKGHFFFNTWTMCTMMAEVLETVDTDVDLIILDRGFFDALIWLELQSTRGQVTCEEKSAFARFVTLDRWRSLVDVTVVMTVSPDTAIRRENMNLVIPRTGSIMKPEALVDFNSALVAVKEQYVTRERLFSAPIEFEASHGTVVESNTKLLGELLPKFREWADPMVAVLPRAVVTDLLGKSRAIPAAQAEATWARLRSEIQTKRRSDVEDNEEWVQVVACGVQTHERGVFVLERSARDDKSKNYGKQVVWKGCHVVSDELPDLATLERCLIARMKQDLHLAVDLKPELMGIVWDEDSERFHVGVMFKVPITSPDVARSMQQKEFRRGGRYHTTTGTFQSMAALREASGNLEPWSVRILEGMGLEP